MGLYKLKAKRGSFATHENEKMTVYNPGDTVESKHDLKKMFPDKFQRIGKVQEIEDAEIEQPDIPVLSVNKSAKK